MGFLIFSIIEIFTLITVYSLCKIAGECDKEKDNKLDL